MTPATAHPGCTQAQPVKYSLRRFGGQLNGNALSRHLTMSTERRKSIRFASCLRFLCLRQATFRALDFRKVVENDPLDDFEPLASIGIDRSH